VSSTRFFLARQYICAHTVYSPDACAFVCLHAVAASFNSSVGLVFAPSRTLKLLLARLLLSTSAVIPSRYARAAGLVSP
jgi:hypothetical protein